MEKKTVATHAGKVIANSMIELETLFGHDANGFQRKVRACIALRVKDYGWELLWLDGADWDGINADDLDSIEAIGEMLEANAESRPDRLREGAAALEQWSDGVLAYTTMMVDGDSGLIELADWTHERALTARDAADEEAATA